MIILASPEGILLDFESAAINAYGLLFAFDTKCCAKCWRNFYEI